MKKKIVIPAIVATAVLFAMPFIVPGIGSRKPTLAFYRVPEPVRLAIIERANASPYLAKSGFATAILDDGLPLAAQTGKKRPNTILFTEDGYAAERLSDRATAIPDAVLGKLPSAFVKTGYRNPTVTEQGVQYGLAILADHFELAWSKSRFRELSAPKPQTTASFENALALISRSVKAPLLCAGAQDRELLLLTSALVSARFGTLERERIIRALRDGQDFRGVLSSTKLGETLGILVALRNDRLFYPEWFRMNESDVEGFLAADFAGMAFMTLSAHRRVPLESITKYDSSFFPRDSVTNPGETVAPIYIGMSLDAKPKSAYARDFLYSLVDDKTQATLAAESGLAPVSSSADPPDSQADDVRYWIAASSRAVPDIATASFDDPGRAAAFASEIRAYVEAGGVGY